MDTSITTPTFLPTIKVMNEISWPPLNNILKAPSKSKLSITSDPNLKKAQLSSSNSMKKIWSIDKIFEKAFRRRHMITHLSKKSLRILKNGNLLSVVLTNANSGIMHLKLSKLTLKSTKTDMTSSRSIWPILTQIWDNRFPDIQIHSHKVQIINHLFLYHSISR